MARCTGNDTLQIIPYECPPITKTACTNGKKQILEWDEFHCCQHPVCECVCEGWGSSHYNTFDGSYYSYKGNCTYVLMEEITPKFNLKIYIDGASCDPKEDSSCSRSISVFYGSLVVRLQNTNLNGASKLEALTNNSVVRLPFSQQGVKVINSGINLILEIPRIEVVIKFGKNGFSVFVPVKTFGRNTQGHCGTCNNIQSDDCRLPGGQLVKSCAVMADYWLVKDSTKPNCKKPLAPPTNILETTTKPVKDSVCDLLTSEEGPFAECHDSVSPRNFHSSCVSDSCTDSNQAVECESLESYAAACAQAGVCIDWRNYTKLCASDCPLNKVYKPCGPAEQPTCDDNPDEPPTNVTTEGCFCAEGMKLFNKYSDVCVKTCGCLDPENNPHEFNETFEYKCQDCICEKSKTVTCKPRVCPEPENTTCVDKGYVLVNQTSKLDPCCLEHVCQCQVTTCPVPKISCLVGFKPILSVAEGACCPNYTCVPKKVCVHDDAEYQIGATVPGSEECEECLCSRETDSSSGGLLKINCTVKQCNESCELGMKYVQKDTDKCCGKCKPTHCVITDNGTKQLLIVKTWSPPKNKCEVLVCVKTEDTLVIVNSTVPCPHFNESECLPNTTQTAADGCCKTCVEKDKTCKKVSMKIRITHKGCSSNEEVDMPFCEGSCNTFTKYSQAAASLQHSCSCCKELRSSNRTVNLRCLNGETIPHSYQHVEECACNPTECTKAAVAPARRRRSFSLV
uniref:Intestinal mucin-like protein n=1 Tax=Gouania willdenowi TaxID=441366 RepID=A0A8C5H0F7_GOUWI